MTKAPLPSISVRLVQPFRVVSRELGIDSTDAWKAFGISPEQLDDPDSRIPIHTCQQLTDFVIQLTHLSDYGLRAAEAAEPGLFDLIEYAARVQPTLRGAIDRIARLIPILSDAGTLATVSDGRSVRIDLICTVELHPAIVEFTFAYLLIAAQRSSALPLVPLKLQFAHPAPVDATHHASLFGAPIEFGAVRNAMVFAENALDLPSRHADSRLGAMLDQLADHLLAKVARHGSFSDDVRRLVTKHLASDGAPVTTIAQELGMTARTLHRRLADEGTTFRDLADNVRKELAFAYMDRPELAVGEVAYLLGFSGVQAFHRAFKRWAQRTPGEFRKQR